MNWFSELVYLLTISSSIYAVLSCICRLRYANICFLWSTLYTGFLGHSLWSVSNIVNSNADARDVTITLMITLYIFMTKSAWSDGVPEVAKRKGAKNA